MGTYVSYEAKDYGLITLNRPDKHHAINLEMAGELSQIIREAKNSDILFLAITSTGMDYFCAGGDLNVLHSNLSKEEAQNKLLLMNEVLYELVTFPVPVICLLQGNALGGGCEIATACDIRIAREGTAFGFVQTKVGILPGWGGGAILYRKVAPDFAHHWLLNASVHHTDYLYRKGWLQEVYSGPNWDIDTILAPYIKRDKEQMILLKKQYKYYLKSTKLAEEMKQETANCATLWGSKTHRTYISHFEKR